MKLENLLIETTIKDNTYAGITDEKLDLSYSDESLLNQNYWFKIYKTDDEFEKIEQIGYIEMTYIDVWMAEEVGYHVYDLFDLIDSEKEGICEYLFDFDGFENEEYVGIEKDVLFIDYFYIEKKYRNMGIGSKLVKELPRLVRHILKLKPGCIALLANPFEREGKDIVPITDKKEIEKLISFYVENGFERIKNTKYLVKNMDKNY